MPPVFLQFSEGVSKEFEKLPTKGPCYSPQLHLENRIRSQDFTMFEPL